MKSINVFFLLPGIWILTFNFSHSQGVVISEPGGGTTPDPSAILDLQSEDKGLLIPRMDSTTRMAIASPAEGLMVFDSTYNALYCHVNGQWEKLEVPSVVFERNGDLVSPSTGYATDDFLFGSPQTEHSANPDYQSRMFFMKEKSAFRAGASQDANWNPENIGEYSFAGGRSSLASGLYSTAFGNGKATNTYSTALGFATKAAGFASTALGDNTEANGAATVALGFMNDPLVSPGTGYLPQTPMLIVGNGFFDPDLISFIPSNALTVRYDGKVALGNITPTEILDVNGAIRMRQGASDGYIPVSDADGKMIWTDPDLLGYGTFIRDDTIVRNNGSYTTDNFLFGSPQIEHSANPDYQSRMFFLKDKSAFRVGKSINGNWNPANIGDYSFAAGWGALASGHGSVAFGFNEATEAYATALGYSTGAHGYASTAIGTSTTANGYGTLAVGMFNDPLVNPGGFYGPETPMFVVGNGDVPMPPDPPVLSNALTVRHDGKVALGNITPTEILDVDGAIRMRQGASDGYIPVSDADGKMTWTDPALLSFGTFIRDESTVRTNGKLYVKGTLRVDQKIQADDAGGLEFATAEGTTRIHVNDNGNIGIGTSIPGVKLHIVTGGGTLPNPTFGLRLDRDGISHWTINPVGNDLFFYHKTTPRAFLNHTNGAWQIFSDARLKKNVVDVSGILGKVAQLEAKQYHFNTQSDDEQKTYGFMAQEVNEIIPDAVHYDENSDRYSINYDVFGVLAIEAIREQQEIIEKQEARLAALEGQMKEFRAMIGE